ncbi:MAG: YdcF family protein [Lachnospiraceae bacterium]|nr:YdcF family protein [Lachnospiraceae bacterium]
MKKLYLRILITFIIIAIACSIWWFASPRTVTGHYMLSPGCDNISDYTVTVTGENVIECISASIDGEYLKFEVRAVGRGSADLVIDVSDGGQGLFVYRVGAFNNIYCLVDGNFSGCSAVLVGITAFFLIAAFMLINYYRSARDYRLYSYNTIYAAGFGIMLMVVGVYMLIDTMEFTLSDGQFNMYSIYKNIAGSASLFMFVTFPVVLVFAVTLFVSNVELLRHERRRLANVLGIILSVLLIAGQVVAFVINGRYFTGSLTELRIHETLFSLYTSVYVYFECMLFGAAMCALKAAKHEPEGRVDYILILGCKFRKDGSLTPLLKGRVDRAVKLWNAQRESGYSPYLIPSGGQGSDESMAEAAAMKNYLLKECNIPEEYIIAEENSKNTFENMKFSKEIIEGRGQDAEGKVVFSTTNYHVFRSGVWASLAGLRAEGIGSRTKWWFWPNAFVRECVGLLKNKLGVEILLLILLTALFAFLNMFQA